MENAGSLKLFLKYSSLNVLGMVGISCYILADTYFVSKGLGTYGLSALNLAIPVFSLINGLGLMLGMGSATKYGIFKSQNKTESGNKVYSQTMMTALFLGVLIILAGIFFAGNISSLIGADENTFDMTKTYLQVLMIFSPAFLFNAITLAFVRNDGDPRLSMFAMLTGSFSNIILDYVFIFPFNMGIFGAILATGMAPIISLLVLSTHFLRRKNNFRLVKTKINMDTEKEVFLMGLPSMITELSSGIVILIFNILILNIEGNVGVAAYGVIANISLVVIAMFTGMSQGVQPLLSDSYGRGNNKNVNTFLKYAVVSAIFIGIAAYIVLFIWAEPISNIFNSENNERLTEIAVGGMKIYFTGAVFAGLNIVLSLFFTSTENPLPAHVITLLRGFFVIVPMSFILSYVLKMTGIWLVFPVTEIIVSLVAFMLYFKNRKKYML